jgi:integrase
MPTLYRRKGHWYFQARIGRQRIQRSLKTQDRRIAEYLMGEELKRLHLGVRPAILAVVTVLEAQSAYLADCTPRLRPSYLKRRSDALESLLKPLQGYLLRYLDTATCNARLHQMAQESRWGAKTYNNYRDELFSFLRWCQTHQRWLNENPLHPIKRRKVMKNPVEYLRGEEITQCLHAAEGHWLRPAIAIGIYAGLRGGEIRALEWENIDFQAKTITVKNKVGFTTKTGKFRVVPLSQGLADLLLPYRRTGQIIGKRQHTQYALYRLKKAAKLPMSWNWVIFRHTFGTHHALRGVPLATLAEWMGHSSPSITYKYYIGQEAAYNPLIERFSPPNGAKSGDSP